MVKATGGTSNQIYYPVLSKCQKETHCKNACTCCTPAVLLISSCSKASVPVPSLDLTSHYEVPAPSPGSLCSCHACPWWSHLVERGGHDVERGGLGLRPLVQPHPHERWRSVWVWRPRNNSPTTTGTFGESPWSRLPHNNNNNHYN